MQNVLILKLKKKLYAQDASTKQKNALLKTSAKRTYHQSATRTGQKITIGTANNIAKYVFIETAQALKQRKKFKSVNQKHA